MSPLVAQHHGLCVVCSKYMTVGRSKIDSLPLIMPPDPAKTSYRARTSEWFVAGGKVRSPQGSKWAHERCVAAAWRKWTTGDQWEAERARRVAALRQMRVREEADR